MSDEALAALMEAGDALHKAALDHMVLFTPSTREDLEQTTKRWEREVRRFKPRESGYYWVHHKGYPESVLIAEWIELCKKWFFTGVSASDDVDAIVVVSKKLVPPQP